MRRASAGGRQILAQPLTRAVPFSILSVLVRLVQIERGRYTLIVINPRDPRPIYLQIKEGLCRLILSGAVKTGERLPSVRELAGQLAINPNTIQRAYRELENDGFIYSISGKGSFAAALDDVDAGRRSAKEREFRAAAQELLRLGTPKADLMAILDQLEEEDSHA